MPKFRTLIVITTPVVFLTAYVSTVNWRAPKTSFVVPIMNSRESVDDRSAGASRHEGIHGVQILAPTVEVWTVPDVPAPNPVLDGIHEGMKADEMEHRRRMRRALLRGPIPGIEPLE